MRIDNGRIRRRRNSLLAEARHEGVNSGSAAAAACTTTAFATRGIASATTGTLADRRHTCSSERIQRHRHSHILVNEVVVIITGKTFQGISCGRRAVHVVSVDANSQLQQLLQTSKRNRQSVRLNCCHPPWQGRLNERWHGAAKATSRGLPLFEDHANF